MDFEFSTQGTNKILMIKYAVQILDDFPEVLKTSATSSEAEHLLQVQDNGKNKLPEEQAQDFHYSVAQLLFLEMSARPDVLTLILLLTKRVREPDEDGWVKLKPCLKYLMGTRHMKLVLTIDSKHTIHWYMDASYGTRSNFQSSHRYDGGYGLRHSYEYV